MPRLDHLRVSNESHYLVGRVVQNIKLRPARRKQGVLTVLMKRLQSLRFLAGFELRDNGRTTRHPAPYDRRSTRWMDRRPCSWSRPEVPASSPRLCCAAPATAPGSDPR